jgi:hypothetical protein
MKQAVSMKVIAAALLFVAGAFLLSTGPLTSGQETKLKGRLPAYFADIVTDQQRQRIYEIQASYTKTREALEAQLEELKDKEMTEIEAVLTAPQRLALEKARGDAAFKRKKTAADKKAAELTTKSEGPAKKAKGGK